MNAWTKETVKVWCALIALNACGFAAGYLAAQEPTAEQLAQQIERAQVLVPHTRTWQVAQLDGTSVWLPSTRVDVIDTAGVCLYIARTTSSSVHQATTIAAVPKTALPPGTGCQ